MARLGSWWLGDLNVGASARADLDLVSNPWTALLKIGSDGAKEVAPISEPTSSFDKSDRAVGNSFINSST
jgi:hypothetical protein